MLVLALVLPLVLQAIWQYKSASAENKTGSPNYQANGCKSQSGDLTSDDSTLIPFAQSFLANVTTLFSGENGTYEAAVPFSTKLSRQGQNIIIVLNISQPTLPLLFSSRRIPRSANFVDNHRNLMKQMLRYGQALHDDVPQGFDNPTALQANVLSSGKGYGSTSLLDATMDARGSRNNESGPGSIGSPSQHHISVSATGGGSGSSFTNISLAPSNNDSRQSFTAAQKNYTKATITTVIEAVVTIETTLVSTAQNSGEVLPFSSAASETSTNIQSTTTTNITSSHPVAVVLPDDNLRNYSNATQVQLTNKVLPHRLDSVMLPPLTPVQPAPPQNPQGAPNKDCKYSGTFQTGCNETKCNYRVNWFVGSSRVTFALTAAILPSMWTGIGFNTVPRMPGTYGLLALLTSDDRIQLAEISILADDSVAVIRYQNSTSGSYANGMLNLNITRPLAVDLSERNKSSLGNRGVISLNQCLYYFFPTAGGKFSVLPNGRLVIQKHQRTPTVSAARVCLCAKPCKPNNW